jgi:hypothetical protein
MIRLFRSILWFLLVPYFTVASIPARPWFGGPPEFARRLNAQLSLVLILVWPLILLAPRKGRLAEAIGANTYVFAALVMLPAWWLVSKWLSGNRERQYAAAYRALPRWQRVVFGLSTLTFMVASLIVGISHAPSKHTPAPRLVCDDEATQVTADACYER